DIAVAIGVQAAERLPHRARRVRAARLPHCGAGLARAAAVERSRRRAAVARDTRRLTGARDNNGYGGQRKQTCQKRLMLHFVLLAAPVDEYGRSPRLARPTSSPSRWNSTPRRIGQYADLPAERRGGIRIRFGLRPSRRTELIVDFDDL